MYLILHYINEYKKISNKLVPIFIYISTVGVIIH